MTRQGVREQCPSAVCVTPRLPPLQGQAGGGERDAELQEEEVWSEVSLSPPPHAAVVSPLCSAVGLAFGAKFAEDEKLVVSSCGGGLMLLFIGLWFILLQADPFKLKTGGGLVDLKDIKPSEFDGCVH